ncbi:hypothetical protein J1614_008242 [Plenodomus biglobosus]|nr:hypothetical protein J1614_008242 [Plenodomus biglobosus]
MPCRPGSQRTDMTASAKAKQADDVRAGAKSDTNGLPGDASAVFPSKPKTTRIKYPVYEPRLTGTAFEPLKYGNGRQKGRLTPVLSTPSTQATTFASNSATRSLRDLHIAIGQHRVQCLPTFSSLTLDSTGAEQGYLPIAVRIGSYLPADHHPLIGRTYSIWAYQTMPVGNEFKLNSTEPHTPIELAAFKQNNEHVSIVPGIGRNPSWENIQRYVQLCPEFALVRNIADLTCLVRYALLLAADAGLYGFDGADVPLGIGFTHQLVEIGERGCHAERFRIYEATGVLPGYGDRKTQGTVEKEKVVREDAVVHSASESSSGDDEIPAVDPEVANRNKRSHWMSSG